MRTRIPFPSICVAVGVSDASKLLEQVRKELVAGERFFEIRLDYLATPDRGIDVVRKLSAEQPDCTILATCRRQQNHGKFGGSIDEQLRMLGKAIQAGAHAVDVDIESAEPHPERLEPLREKAALVVSYHNFESTPPTDALLRRMQRVPADAYKVVTTARKPSDNLRVLTIFKAHPRVSIVAFAMGEYGVATRILSPGWGAAYTFAAPSALEGTAPGQVSAAQLRHTFRIDKFSRAAKVYGVVADPVRHSISPAVHNRAFQARRMDAVYLPFLVAPNQLKDFFTLANELPISGASITIPHKQKIIRYLDVIDPLARRIGAVNTIWKKGGKWRGTNTDANAIVKPLGKHVRLSKASVLVAGNGGAARSAAFALVDSGAKVSIAGRNMEHVRALAKASGSEALTREQSIARGFDAVVHATPLGMFPHMDQCFFDGKIPANVVFDMVYNPFETVLLKRAAAQGATTIRGLEMFLQQAAQQFEIWTGDTAPHAAMEKAALEALTHSA